MKSKLCLTGYFLSIGILVLHFSGCKTQPDKSSQNLYYDFQTSVEKIKQKLFINDDSMTIYFQRTLTLDSMSIIPAIFFGEFISSKSTIKFFSPSYPLKYYELNSSEIFPEKIIFMPEIKSSDTMYYYLDYSYRNYGIQILEPVAYIISDGKIVPLQGYNKYISYLEKRIRALIGEITLNH